MGSFLEMYGPWALVTGASSGIGAEFVRQLASHGLNVVLIARRVEMLEELSGEVKSKHGVETKVITADLTNDTDLSRALSDTDGLDIGLVINNAGTTVRGSFVYSDISKHTDLISLNVTAVTKVAHAFARRFVNSREKSGMIFVSSIAKNAAFCPWMGTYSGSKAFASNLAGILKFELKDANVDVLTLEPGVVDTPMAAISEFDKMGWPVCPTADCVMAAVDALPKGVFKVMPGQDRDEEAEKEFMGNISGVSGVMKKAWTNKKMFELKPEK